MDPCMGWCQAGIFSEHPASSVVLLESFSWNKKKKNSFGKKREKIGKLHNVIDLLYKRSYCTSLCPILSTAIILITRWFLIFFLFQVLLFLCLLSLNRSFSAAFMSFLMTVWVSFVDSLWNTFPIFFLHGISQST